MTLRKLFEKQVFIRLTDDQVAFVCTAKWPFLSRTRRVDINECGSSLASQVRESASAAKEEVPMLRRIRRE
jgi:hypothetical protein